VLTPAEIEEFEKDGFLFVDHPVLPISDILEVRRLADGLFDAWAKLPRRLAPNVKGDAPPVLEIKHAMALDAGFRHISVVDECRKLACTLLGAKRVWCHFDHIIYKHPGGERIAWHQDAAASRSGMLERAVHFWIPLHDLAPESGCMMFVPGSHTGGVRQHVPQTRVGGVQLKLAESDTDFVTVTKTLPMGGFSIHTPHTLHSSAPNQGTELRKAWILQFGTGLPAAALDVSRRRLPVWLSKRLES
jgi:hypothetical protein